MGSPIRSRSLTQAFTEAESLRGTDRDFVERKAQLQLDDWAEAWDRKLDVEKAKKEFFGGRDEAAQRTEEAAGALNELESLLSISLENDPSVDWNLLKSSEQFSQPRPIRESAPPPPPLKSVPREPLPTDEAYQAKLNLLDKLVASRAQEKIRDAGELFRKNHEDWAATKRRIESQNETVRTRYAESLSQHEAAHAEDVQAWNDARDSFTTDQARDNSSIDRQQAAYLAGDERAIEDYCDLVLSRSSYPEYMPRDWVVDYIPETKVLVVDYSLPAPDELPTLTEVKYTASKSEFVEKHRSPVQSAKLYDDVGYQITLRTIHELFTADAVKALSMITLNGYVKSIDKATGQLVNPCVLSIQVTKADLDSVNLAHVDPKACFKKFKGVGSSKLHSMAAVAPIMSTRREDGRFIAAHDVAYQLDDSYNLAAMDWEDFEHLIRELFEKEFAVNGGEVKVTQASRDGGVDAVAFDPDPIRGGKIVIQAKRYTHTVGVAAVRDLYGTVMNEGATKGILVTTSDYGPDAYQFVSNKPLTLLNGANLLHLLEKHGHKAKIDIQAARVLAMQQKGTGTVPN